MKKLISLVILSTLSVFPVLAAASQALKSIDNLEDLGYFTQTYYQSPRPDLIPNALHFIDKQNPLDSLPRKITFMTAFSCIFSNMTEEQRAQYRKVVGSLNQPYRKIFTISLNKSPEKILNATPLSPMKNDMNWGCFFVTGDAVYINNIINTLIHMDDRKDMTLFLTAASAKWSLSSNARNFRRVKEVLDQNNDATLTVHIQDLLAKDADQVSEETLQLFKNERQQGAWKGSTPANPHSGKNLIDDLSPVSRPGQ